MSPYPVAPLHIAVQALALFLVFLGFFVVHLVDCHQPERHALDELRRRRRVIDVSIARKGVPDLNI